MPAPRVSIGLGLYTGQQPAGAEPRGYRDAPVLAAAAEAAGFDAFWVSEHHSHHDGYLPSPLTVLAACAAVTSRITLATGLALAPLYNPMRLATDAAVVDQLSGGRLLLGLGLGYIDEEYRAFSVDRRTRAQRFEETIDVLRLAWTGKIFSYVGRVHSLEDVRVTPAAVRASGVPIWLGGYAGAALERAGRMGDGHLVGRGAPEIVDRAAQGVRSGLARRSAPATDFTMAVNLAVVLDGPKGHGTEARRAFAAQQAGYERIQRGRDVYAGLVADASDADLALGSISSYLQADGPAPAIATAVDRVVRQLAGWASVHVVLRALFPEADLAAQLERIAALGKDVLPRIARG